MKYAYKNGKILDGTKEMQVQTSLILLTDRKKNHRPCPGWF